MYQDELHHDEKIRHSMRHIEVVCAIVHRDDEILIAQRSKGEFAGLWEFPGGKIERGETRQDALRREMMEELAVAIHIESLLTTIQHTYSDFHLTMHCFLCSLPEGEVIEMLDHTAIRWVAKKHWSDVQWIEADVQVVEMLREVL